jgi:hypothetical protein
MGLSSGSRLAWVPGAVTGRHGFQQRFYVGMGSSSGSRLHGFQQLFYVGMGPSSGSRFAWVPAAIQGWHGS